MVTDELLKLKEVADRLRVDPETVRRWLVAGRLKGFRPGGTKTGWRIPSSELDAFMRGADGDR